MGSWLEWNSYCDNHVGDEFAASGTKRTWESFVHALEEMSQYRYVLAKLCREVTTWEELTVYFTHTFIFMQSNQYVHNVL